MGNDVFANGREISCKKADGKSIGAFPDVCFTPPQTPATPLGAPVPYPSNAFAKDTKKGSKNVKISGQEVMLKNKSYFKKSTGDEAGRAPKKGIVTSKIQGKVYFTSWSPNVKSEGKNVVRHLDLTTHNHSGSNPTNAPPTAHVDSVAVQSQEEKCNAEKNEEKEICSKEKPEGSWRETKEVEIKYKGKTRKEMREVTTCSDACKKAKACALIPKEDDKKKCCHPDDTGHHIFPNSLLQEKRGDSGTNVGGLKKPPDKDAYTEQGGMCVCVNRSVHKGKHKALHKATREGLEPDLLAGKTITYEQVLEVVAKAHAENFQNDEDKPLCDKECIKRQIDASIPKTGDEIKIRQQNGVTCKDYSKYKKNNGVTK